MAFPVFLFDIDGVLVEPGGYRQSCRAAMERFTLGCSLPAALLPDEPDYLTFEAHRITSEWDMAPVALAILLEAMLAADPTLPLPDRPEDLLSAQIAARLLPEQVDYRGPVRRLGDHLRAGEYPAESARRISADLFPRLRRTPLLEPLLSNTRDAYRSITTRLFQHYTLGSRGYEAAYQLPALVETPSLLQASDRPLLPAALKDRLLGLVAAGEAAATAYTLRPSLPPREVPPPYRGYAPEAELALERVGLPDLPLIGYGRMRYLGEQAGLEPETLIKPSPVQALAGIFAALTGRELDALRLALGLYLPESGAASAIRLEAIRDRGPYAVNVFEDSAGGIEAVFGAVEVLNRSCVPATVRAYGIAQDPEKVQALEATGAPVFATTAAAVEAALAG